MIQSSHGSCYSGIVYDINGPKCAHYGLRKIKATFAEKGGKTAENNGMLTKGLRERQQETEGRQAGKKQGGRKERTHRKGEQGEKRNLPGQGSSEQD